jgi:non-ribosomal peptide synthetase component F/acyl carrier protein
MNKLAKKNIEDLLALTPMQEGMLFHHLKSPGSCHGFEQLCLEISGEIDVELYKEAWQVVVRRNEMLRTFFRWEKVENPLQIVLKKSQPQLEYYVFPGKENSRKKKWLEEIKAADKEKKFDLRDIPFRVTLCRTGKDEYTMIISNHHILYDGWSSGIILKEFFESYEDLDKKKQQISSRVPPPARTKFKRFLEAIQRREVEADKEFWQKYLEGMHREKPLPQKSTKRREITSTGHYQIKLPEEMNKTLEEAVKSHNITLASFLYAVWGFVLQQYGSTNDVLFDTTVSGRNLKIKGIEDIVGLFINTLPLRINSQPREKIADFLTRTAYMLQQWSEFQDSSLETINEYLDDGLQASLFDSVLVIENYPLDRILMQKNSTLTVKGFSISAMTRYDLTVLITVASGITLNFIYNNELFDETIITKLGEDILNVINYFPGNPHKELATIALLTGEVRNKLANRSRSMGFDHREGEPTGELPGATGAEAPRDTVENKLLDLWAELFPGEKTTMGIDTNFFDLGGHSLKASLLRKRIEKEFQVKVPLVEVFQSPTIRQLARFIRKAGKTEHESIEAVEEKEYYELSSAQKRMYNVQQRDVESTAYNVSSFLDLAGAVDKETAAGLEQVFIRIIKRHESLRTSFPWVTDKPCQQIHRQVEFAMEYRANNSTLGTGSNLQQVCSDFIRPFALAQAPLLRVGLCRLEEARSLLMLDLHHIITDAVSMNLLINEFNALYKGEPLPPLQFQHKTFCQWQQHRLNTGQLHQQQNYWLKELSGQLPMLNLLYDFRRPLLQSFQGDRVHFVIDKKLTRQLNRYLRETKTTLFIMLLAVFNVLLHMYTAQDDILIGSTVAGRNSADLDHIAGLFIETLVLRNYPTGDKTFAAFLQEVKERTFIAFENTDYPFGELMKKVGAPGDLSRNPLFSAMLIVQNVDMAELEIEGLTSTLVPFTPKTAKVDLTLEAAPAREEINCHLEYCTQLFKQEAMERMASHVVNILREVLRSPGLVLSELELMSEKEKQQILENFRENQLPWGKQEKARYFMTQQLFEQQVKQSPDTIAVVYQDKQFTYRQLDNKAGDLAKALHNLN